MKIDPGGDFCKIFYTSAGQQVLIVLEASSEGKPIFIARATFETSKGSCMLMMECVIPGLENPQDLFIVPSNSKNYTELADLLVKEMRDSLLSNMIENNLDYSEGVVQRMH